MPYGLRASRLGYDNRKRIPPFYVKNAQGIYDDGRHVVDIEDAYGQPAWHRNRLRQWNRGPSVQSKGLPVYPNVPAELAEKAAQMFARRHELRAKQQSRQMASSSSKGRDLDLCRVVSPVR